MTEGFVDAERGMRLTGPSTSDRALVATLERHGAEEGQILARYEVLADQLHSPAARYLVSFILDDERRHHRIVEELANTVAWGGYERDPAVAKVPPLAEHQGETADFIAETQILLDFEKSDRRELRRLRKDLDEYADTTVWALLVDTMILDTDKHIRILKFLVRHLSIEPAASS